MACVCVVSGGREEEDLHQQLPQPQGWCLCPCSAPHLPSVLLPAGLDDGKSGKTVVRLLH